MEVLYCHMGSWLEHQCHTKDVPLTLSNITHTVWQHTDTFNTALTFYNFSTDTLSSRLCCTSKATFLLDTYFFFFNHVEDETRHQRSIHTGSYLVRIKVQKHKLDNHPLGYSKFCLGWTGDFSGRTLIVWKCEVTPRSVTFKEFWFQCHSDSGGSEIVARPRRGGRGFTFRADHFMILARHHPYKLCEKRGDNDPMDWSSRHSLKEQFTQNCLHQLLPAMLMEKSDAVLKSALNQLVQVSESTEILNLSIKDVI